MCSISTILIVMDFNIMLIVIIGKNVKTIVFVNFFDWIYKNQKEKENAIQKVLKMFQKFIFCEN